MRASRFPCFLAIFGMLAFAEAAHAGQNTSSVCPRPDFGLIPNDPDVDARTIPFSAEGATYQIDIFSGFAPQSEEAGSPFCVRYEVENSSGSDILVFTWPLAGVTIGRIEVGPGNRPSWVKTVGATRPVIADTKLYAFKSTTLHSKAYQEEASLSVPHLPSLLYLIATTSEDHRTVLPEAGEQIPISSGATVPRVGAEFSVAGAKVGVGSDMGRSDKEYQFTLAIEHSGSDSVKEVIAPFAWALTKASSPDEIEALTKEFQLEALPMKGGEFLVDRTFPVDQIDGAPYLIEHPVTFVQGDNRVCFLSPSYSPVIVSPDVLSCN